jgi:putative spermidine/putrescine transport system permease protein
LHSPAALGGAEDIAVRALVTAPPPEVQGRERRNRLTRWLLLLPTTIVIILFLFYPLGFIVQLSFTEGNSYLSSAGPVATIDNYLAMASRYLPNLLITIQLASLAVLVNLVFGFPFAYILVRRIRYRNLVRGFMVFPLFGALYIAFGMRLALLPGGPLGSLLTALGIAPTQLLYSLPAVVFAMSIFTFPFMVMNIGTSLSNVDPKLEEAAACLGAGSWQTFTRVLLPLTRAGILAGSLIVFGWSIGTFAEPVFLGTVYEQRSLAWSLFRIGVMQGDYGLSSTMAVVLLVLAFLISFVALRYSRGALLD